jgi:hypothetical protein
MKLELQKEHIKTNITNTPTQFSIANDPIVYSIFSDKLYTNKHQAILRELVSNAWDAHVVANNQTTPIEVQLPTYLEPTLRIRDFGTGLHPEVVLNNTTVFFWSDKRGTNELIGGLGLGMKSPFCYTDNYTVISYWHGTKYTFSCYKENHKPHCILVSEINTDEPNGLEIIINTNNDVCDWVYEAKRVLPWFPNLQVNHIIPEIKWTATGTLNNLTTNITVKDCTWGILHTDNRENLYLRNRFYFLQGNVLYNLNEKDINNHEYLKDNADFKSFKGTCVITVPIGTLSVAVSRESLSLDPQTYDKTGKLINIVLYNIRNYYMKEINKAPDLIAALLYAIELNQSLDIKHITYKGFDHPVSKNINISLSPKTQDFIINNELTIYQFEQPHRSYRRRGTPTNKFIDKIEKHLLYNLDKLHFVGISDHLHTKKTILENIPSNPGHYSLYIHYQNQEALNSLLKDCHNFPTIKINNLSNITQPKKLIGKQIQTKNIFTPTTVKRWKCNEWIDYRTEEGIEYYTIQLHNRKPQLPFEIDFTNLISCLEPWDKPIIGIPTTTPKYLIPKGEFNTQIVPIIINKIKTFCNSYDKDLVMTIDDTTRCYENLIKPVLTYMEKEKTNLNVKSPLKAFFNLLTKAHTTKINREFQSLLSCHHKVLKELNINPTTIEISIKERETHFQNFWNKLKKLEELYPILGLLIDKANYEQALITTFHRSHFFTPTVLRIMMDYDKVVCNPQGIQPLYPPKIPTIF